VEAKPSPNTTGAGEGPVPPGHSLIVEPDDGRTAVLAAIAGATTSLDLAIYELSDPTIVSALLAAQARHVAVRVLYNWYSFSPEVQREEVTPVIQQLTRGGVACRPAPRAFEVTHEKALQIDGERALVLTFNLAEEYFQSTRDFGIVTTVPAEVAEIGSVFDADWNDRPAAASVPSLLWSPVNARSKLASLVQNARVSLDVYCEEASDPGILGGLVAAARRGVRVRVIAAVLQSDGTANENAPGITYLHAGGVEAVSKSFPVPTPSGEVPIYIHAKVIVADAGTVGAGAFVGSENLSCTSLDDNRECGLLVNEPPLLERIEATFTADWAQPSTPVLPDPTPLAPCPPNASGRSRARIASRR
jgi:cardiolipin synthase A/B